MEALLGQWMTPWVAAIMGTTSVTTRRIAGTAVANALAAAQGSAAMAMPVVDGEHITILQNVAVCGDGLSFIGIPALRRLNLCHKMVAPVAAAIATQGAAQGA